MHVCGVGGDIMHVGAEAASSFATHAHLALRCHTACRSSPVAWTVGCCAVVLGRSQRCLQPARVVVLEDVQNDFIATSPRMESLQTAFSRN